MKKLHKIKILNTYSNHGVMVNFMCQLGQAIVPSRLVKHQVLMLHVGIFLEAINIFKSLDFEKADYPP